MEQCLYCQSCYELEESDAIKKNSCCSIECENKLNEWLDKPFEFED